MKKWWSGYIQVMRVALQDDRQMQEKLGIVTPRHQLILTIDPHAKTAKKPLNKRFVGSRGGFSKEPLAAGGIFC